MDHQMLYKIAEEEVKDAMRPENVALRKSLRHLDAFLDTIQAIEPSQVSKDHVQELIRYVKQYVSPQVNEFIGKWKSGQVQGQNQEQPPPQQKVAENIEKK